MAKLMLWLLVVGGAIAGINPGLAIFLFAAAAAAGALTIAAWLLRS